MLWISYIINCIVDDCCRFSSSGHFPEKIILLFLNVVIILYSSSDEV
jgi:hypothetical protein